MIGRGLKARTAAGESGGIALSGSLWSTCEGKRIPEPPTVPNADFREALDEGAVVRERGRAAILREAAGRVTTSDRARVLVQLYWPAVEDLGLRVAL